MTRLPRLTGRRVVAALRKAGFEVIRIKGSHHFLTHADGRCTPFLSIPAKPSDLVFFPRSSAIVRWLSQISGLWSSDPA